MAMQTALGFVAVPQVRVSAKGLRWCGAATDSGAEAVQEVGASYRNHAEFERFVREREQPLRQFLLRMRVSEHDVADVAQESFTRLLRYCDSEPASAWQALLYQIAINAMRDRARRAQVERGIVQDVASAVSIDEAVSHEPSPEQHASNRQQLTLMRSAVMNLPPRCREAYLLHRIEGMTYPEIARHSGVSLKAVEKSIARALKLLREQLKTVCARNEEDVV